MLTYAEGAEQKQLQVAYCPFKKLLKGPYTPEYKSTNTDN
jgi:hypothetical protein